MPHPRAGHGTMDDGTPYAASDPHLLMWVHVAEVDSLRATPSTAPSRWSAPTATPTSPRLARSPAASGSSTRRRLRRSSRRCWRRTDPRLRGTAEAQEAVVYLLLRPLLPLPRRSAVRRPAAAAVGLMPRWTWRPLRFPPHGCSPS